MRAALLLQTGNDKLELSDDVQAEGPGAGEVRVQVRATGVCHSDLSAMKGVLPQPAPFVAGHEGAGEVVAVGEGVDAVKVGDRVVLCWIPPCGSCRFCRGGQPNLCIDIFFAASVTPRFSLNGSPLYGFAGTGTFAEELVVPYQCAVPIPADVPYELAALIGCGVTTGVGAVFNNARVTPGSSVAVIGCGGVGISVIQGARIAGAAEIVAVDPVERKREWARRFGASHAVGPDELAAAKQEITGGDGFDYVFEVVGRSETVRQAYDTTRRGGTVVVVGAGAADDQVSFNMFELFFDEKRLLSSIYGGGDVRRDYDRLIRLWRSGRLDLEGMVTAQVTLDEINDALDAMRGGEVIRTVVTFGAGG
jgi:S-(hydroxymethyl)glutathione dehydrogenase / alcohol dehydrogenase